MRVYSAPLLTPIGIKCSEVHNYDYRDLHIINVYYYQENCGSL